jgi:hypothetical protein
VMSINKQAGTSKSLAMCKFPEGDEESYEGPEHDRTISVQFYDKLEVDGYYKLNSTARLHPDEEKWAPDVSVYFIIIPP